MTDIKKAPITSTSSNKVEKKEGKKKQTIRLLLALPESNEKSCPEFNYGDLLSQHLHRRLGKHRLGDVINGPLRDKGDPDASDEDEALKALARQFEKKYGGGVVGGPRRRKNNKNDFKQLGEGYDETDPFIDNSDAVDDMLATNMETKLGGFYINSGMLKFEEVQVSEDEESSDINVQGVKKRRQNEISSSDEEEVHGEIEKSESKIRENGVLKVKKRKLDEGEILRRRKKMINKFNAKKRKERSDTSENEMDTKVPDTPSEDAKAANETSIAASIEAVVSKAREGTVLDQIAAPQEAAPFPNVAPPPPPPLPPTTQEDQLSKEVETAEEDEEDDDDERENEKDESSSSECSSSSSCESSLSDSDSDDDKDKGSESGKEELDKKAAAEEEQEEEEVEDEEEQIEDETAMGRVTEVGTTSFHGGNDLQNASDSDKDNALPSDLSPSLIAALDRIKEFAKNNKASSQKFFTEPVNKLLLSIEIKLVNFEVRKKNRVYNHLSQHLPCGTQTLIKRGKNLLAERLEERMKPAIQKLKNEIDLVMPPLIEAHALECQKIAEKKGEGAEHQDEENTMAEASKRIKLPKKKFAFTPELRDLFLDIVRTGSQRWNWIRKRSETAESYVKSFIDSHLKNLWPKGWVTTKFLYKESQSAHSFITAKKVKSKKSMVSKKLTVLDGGTVSNANLIPGPELKDQIVTTAKYMENGKTKGDVCSEEVVSLTSAKCVEPKPSHNVPQKKDLKNEDKLGEAVAPASSIKRPGKVDIENAPRSVGLVKTPATQGVKLIPPKPANAISPPKESSNRVPSDAQLLSVSPASESSPKSFHGFESPTKAYDTLRGSEVSIAKQSLVFDSISKKQSKMNDHSDSLPPVREGKPPKPSLTATALPKLPMVVTVMGRKADGLNKGHGDLPELPKAPKEDRKAVTCISIKSVEKINETVGTCAASSKSDKGRDMVATSVPVELSSPREKRPPPPPPLPLTADTSSSAGVRVIDLASEEERGPPKGTSGGSGQRKDVIGSIGPSVSIVPCENSKGSSASGAHLSPGGSKNDSFSKNHKLQQEMDQVMNELLQISKKNLNSSGVEEMPSKLGGSGAIPETSKSSTISRPLDTDVTNVRPSQHKRQSSHSSSHGMRQSPPIKLSPYDLSKSSSTAQLPKISSSSSNASDGKSQGIHHAYQKQSSSHHSKASEGGPHSQGSQSNSQQYGSTQHGVHQSSVSTSHGLPYGTSQNPTNQSEGSVRTSQKNSGHSSYQNSSSRVPHSQDSYIKSSSVPSNTAGPRRSSPAPPLVNSTPAVISSSSGSSRPQSSSHSSHRTSPSTHSGNHRTSSSSSHSSSSSRHRSSSQSANHRLSTSAHSENHGSSTHNSTSHGVVVSRDSSSSQMRGYTSTSGGSQPSQSKVSGLSHMTPHTSSGSNTSSQSASVRSSNVSSRTSKPSHNIEGLLYNSSTPSSVVNLSQPQYSHVQQQHSSHQSSESQRNQSRFSQSGSGSWSQEPALTSKSSSSNSKTSSGISSKQKTSDNYPASGSSNDPLANLRLMEGLSISNISKKSQSLSGSNSGSRSLGSSSSSHRSSSSVQPKVKQRSDSFSLSKAAHPLFGNLTAEQQQDLWQHMNPGAYLPGISSDVYRYMSQQGHYQGSNTSGSSNKKSSQY